MLMFSVKYVYSNGVSYIIYLLRIGASDSPKLWGSMGSDMGSMSPQPPTLSSSSRVSHPLLSAATPTVDMHANITYNYLYATHNLTCLYVYCKTKASFANNCFVFCSFCGVGCVFYGFSTLHDF